MKINKKAASKLSAYVLVGSLSAAMLSGCGSDEDRGNILEGTILENACVVNLEDGTKDIAIAIEHCNSCYTNYPHYYSVISGEYYTDEKCDINSIKGKPANHHTIISTKPITLTSDEVTKATQSKLDDDDIVAIINRNTETVAEEENTKTK